MKNALLSLLIVFTFISCNQKTNNQEKTSTTEEWKLVYKNDKDGNKLFGSKSDLISYIRKGEPIRVGWASRRKNDTTKTVEHLIDAEFITIANGDEVFAQVKPFLAQRPDLTSDTLSMTLMPVKLHWILSTNGLISSVNLNYGKDTLSTSPPKPLRFNLSWFTKN